MRTIVTELEAKANCCGISFWVVRENLYLWRRKKQLKMYRSLFFLSLLLPTSCSFFSLGNKVAIVAEVNKNKLLATDIEALIPSGLSREDSLAMLRQYINTWALGHLLEAKAQKELPKEQKDVSRSLEEYRRALLVFQYEKSYVETRIDTLITLEEIRKVYNDNKEIFTLSEPVVKPRLIKISLTSPNLAMVRSLYRTRIMEETYQLEQIAHSSAERYDTYNDQWISALNLSRELPISFEEVIRGIKVGFLECTDPLFVYFVSFLDTTLAGSIGPLEYEEPSIRNIILGRRKQELLKKLEKEVLEEGWKTNQLQVYFN